MKMIFRIFLLFYAVCIIHAHVYNPRLARLKTLRSQARLMKKNLAELSRGALQLDSLARELNPCPKVICKNNDIPKECRLKTYFIRKGVKCRGCDNNKCSKQLSDLLKDKFGDLERKANRKIVAKPEKVEKAASKEMKKKVQKSSKVQKVIKPVQKVKTIIDKPAPKPRKDFKKPASKPQKVAKKSAPEPNEMNNKPSKPRKVVKKPAPKPKKVLKKPVLKPKTVERRPQMKPETIIPKVVEVIKKPDFVPANDMKIVGDGPALRPDINLESIGQLAGRFLAPSVNDFSDSLFSRLSKVAESIPDAFGSSQTGSAHKKGTEPVELVSDHGAPESPTEKITKKLEKVVDKLLSIPIDKLVDSKKTDGPSEQPVKPPTGPVLPPLEALPSELRRAPPMPRRGTDNPFAFVESPLNDRFGFDHNNPNLFMPLPDTQIESFAAFAPMDQSLPPVQTVRPNAGASAPQTQQIIDELRSQQSALRMELQRISNQVQGQQGQQQMGPMPFPMMGPDGMPFMGPNPSMIPGGMQAIGQNPAMAIGGMQGIGQNPAMPSGGFQGMGQNQGFMNGQFPIPMNSAPNGGMTGFDPNSMFGGQNMQGTQTQNLLAQQALAGNSWGRAGQQSNFQGQMTPIAQATATQMNLIGNAGMTGGNNWGNAGMQTGNMIAQQPNMATNSWATVPVQNAMPNQPAMGGNSLNPVAMGANSFNQAAMGGNQWSLVGIQPQGAAWGNNNVASNQGQGMIQNQANAAMFNSAGSGDGSANSIHGPIGK